MGVAILLIGFNTHNRSGSNSVGQFGNYPTLFSCYFHSNGDKDLENSQKSKASFCSVFFVKNYHQQFPGNGKLSLSVLFADVNGYVKIKKKNSKRLFLNVSICVSTAVLIL